MPNRNARNETDKYDHSSHSTRHRERGDLRAAPVGELSDGSLPEGHSESAAVTSAEDLPAAGQPRAAYARPRTVHER